MKLFIAIEIPENVQKQITELQKNINFTPDQAKHTFSKEPHITLKFLGEISEVNLPKIQESLKKISFQKFKAEINQNASFANEDYLRVAWFTLEPQQLTQLHQKIEQQLKSVRTKKNKSEIFIPHITIARFKYVKDRKLIIEQIKKLKITAEWKVSSFKLIKSTLTPKGPVYEILEEYKLLD